MEGLTILALKPRILRVAVEREAREEGFKGIEAFPDPGVASEGRVQIL